MSKLDEVLTRLSQMPRQGQAYDHMGRHGWSNPIRKDTGLLLQVLTASVNPKRILEIGTAHGESLMNIHKGAPEAELHTIEWLPEMATEARQNFAEAELAVTVHNGDAMQIIDKLPMGFDLVFLDANKDGYLEQIQKLKKGLHLKPGCWVFADNVIDRQTECQNFLDYMKGCSSVVFPTECGLLVGQV